MSKTKGQLMILFLLFCAALFVPAFAMAKANPRTEKGHVATPVTKPDHTPKPPVTPPGHNK